jgi:neutral ceramidase
MIFKAEASNEENYIAFEWLDVGPSEIQLHLPLVKVEVLINEQWVEMRNAGEPINDDGYDLEIRLLDDEDLGMGQYQARWYNPVAGGLYRFVISPRGQQGELFSTNFMFGADNTEVTNTAVSFVE